MWLDRLSFYRACKEHRRWIKTNGRQGKQADFSNCFLAPEIDYNSELNLKGAIFRGAFLNKRIFKTKLSPLLETGKVYKLIPICVPFHVRPVSPSSFYGYSNFEENQYGLLLEIEQDEIKIFVLNGKNAGKILFVPNWILLSGLEKVL